MKELHHVSIQINRSNLKHNLQQIKQHAVGKRILAIVKKNAYGHGLIEVAKTLQGLVDGFGVIYPYEGVNLRKAWITSPIIVLGATLPSDIQTCIRYDLQFAILSSDHLNEVILSSKGKSKPTQVQLKIDTGMGRIGMPWDNCRALMKAAIEAPEIEVCGILSHLASADTPKNNYTPLQVKRFKTAVNTYLELGAQLPPLHLAASGGILHYSDTHFDMIRPGHILFGVYPDKNSTRCLNLRPVLSLHAKVLFSKKVKAGQSVGYGNIFRPKKDTWISTISIGYGDGFSRKLTTTGRVLAQGKSFPIASSVCMDQLMIDAGETYLPPGEPVVLIGNQGHEYITTEEIANLLGTVPDDILSTLHIDIPRNFVD